MKYIIFKIMLFSLGVKKNGFLDYLLNSAEVRDEWTDKDIVNEVKTFMAAVNIHFFCVG